MTQFRTRTIDGPCGPVFTLTLGEVALQVVSTSFDLESTAYDLVHSGPYFKAAANRDQSIVVVQNAVRPTVAQCDRDGTWHRRLELAGFLPALIGDQTGLSHDELMHRLPLTLVTLAYLEAFPERATREDVLGTFFRNSQDRFEEIVAGLATGEFTYDLTKYARTGVTDPAYSHLKHLGWVYCRQIQLVEQFLNQWPDEVLTVADLGTGGGHFLIILAKALAAKGLLSRVRLIGIDCSDHDLRFARAMMAESGFSAEWIIDDVADPGFADRLRRLKPDVICANHILEHLPGEFVHVENRYLQDWVLAAKRAVSMSVPLGDELNSSISMHTFSFTAEKLEKLARSMETRTGAILAQDIAEAKNGGLVSWVKNPEIQRGGGLSPEVLMLQPNPIEIEPHPILEDFKVPFDPARFNKVNEAQKIGKLEDHQTFAQQGIWPRQVRQLPIKFPKTEVRLPKEFSQFKEAIQLIIDHNKAANADYERSYAYLNIFRGLTKHSSYRGLSLNCHPDQCQGLRPEYWYPPDWSYIASSCLPTYFYKIPFDLSEALNKFAAGEQVDLYTYLNEQAEADINKNGEKNTYRSENYALHLLSPYVIHAAAPAEQDTLRVFIKIAFSTKRFFDNRELLRNPAFSYNDWYEEDTVGLIGGWLSHGHWNERYLKKDVCPDWKG